MSTSETITRTDLTNILNSIGAVTLVDYVTVEMLSKTTGSIPANSGVNVTIGTTKAGYTAVGILGVQFTGSASGYCEPRQFRIENGNVVVYAWNSSSTAYTWTAICWVLYVKNASMLPNKSVDCVVEQGTSGIWTYRKWNSGIAECWGTYSWTATQWNAWGNAYESNSSYVNYPTNLFINTPWFQATGGCDETDHIGLISIETWTSGSNIRTPSIMGTRPSTTSVNKTIVAHLQAKGKWK